MEVGILAVFYLIGSVPAAWIAGKMAGVGDIREQGSGNAGVMNVALNASRLAGLVVFLAEIGKAVITVGLARAMHLGEVLTALGVLAAVLGTRHSIWIGWKRWARQHPDRFLAHPAFLAQRADRAAGMGGRAAGSAQLVPRHPPVAAVAAGHPGAGNPLLALRSDGRGAGRFLPGGAQTHHR